MRLDAKSNLIDITIKILCTQREVFFYFEKIILIVQTEPINLNLFFTGINLDFFFNCILLSENIFFYVTAMVCILLIIRYNTSYPRTLTLVYEILLLYLVNDLFFIN